jgi:hypothetical protein
MMSNSRRSIISGILAIVLLVVLTAGCGTAPQEEEAAVEASPPGEAAVETSPRAEAGPDLDADPAMLAKLEAADALDGSTDKVVSRCPGCALRMEGDADYALDVHGYELHFCSDDCRDGFSEKVEEALLALTIPEESEPEG